MTTATETLTAAERAWIDNPQDDYERKFPETSTKNKANTLRRFHAFRRAFESGVWTPTYSPWRHGGSYVDNIVYPSGAVGCIASARHTASKQFEIACPPSWPGDQFKTRDAAAYAEAQLALGAWAKLFDPEAAR